MRNPKTEKVDGDDIYIDCQPVGKQTDAPKSRIMEYIDQMGGGDFNKKMKHAFDYILKIIIATVVIFGIVYFPKLFQNDSSKKNNNSSGTNTNNGSSKDTNNSSTQIFIGDKNTNNTNK